jgi:hypothetical protein
MPYVNPSLLPKYIKPTHQPGTVYLKINRPLAIPAPSVSKARILTRIVQVGKIDPIYWPGLQAPHMHDILSIALTNTDTIDSLNNQILPSGASGGDWWQIKSFYPSLAKPDGSIAVGTTAQLYYIVSGLGKKDKSVLKELPDGLVVVSGNSKATTLDENLAYKTNRIIYFCLGATSSIDNVGTAGLNSKLSHTFPSCNPVTDYFAVFTKYQDCWDGLHLFTPDMSHVSFSGDKTQGLPLDIDTQCPVGWGKIPELISRRSYYINVGDDTATWSNTSDNVLSIKPNVVDIDKQGMTAHGDVIVKKVYSPIDFFKIIYDNCLTGGDCGSDNLGNGVGLVSTRNID